MALDLPILADDVVGIELLSYLVSATEDATNERETGANEMSEVQEGVLAELCELFAADAGPRNVFPWSLRPLYDGGDLRAPT